MTRQIVYVMATNYSGSHMLAHQLGSHSRMNTVGELLRRRRARYGDMCYRCGSDEDCQIYRGVKDLRISKYYDKIFENQTACDDRVETIIDNSKKVRWARLFLRKKEYSKKFIHLIRDPRALVRRWILSFNTRKSKRKLRIKTARHCPRNFFDVLFGSESNVYIWYWLFRNRQISDFIRKNGLESTIVTYNDLVSAPERSLAELTEWIGYDYEPGQHEYWNFEHHGTVKTSYLNAPAGGRISADQRWKEYLDAETQKMIFEHPHIRSYIEQLGLGFDVDKGLTRY